MSNYRAARSVPRQYYLKWHYCTTLFAAQPCYTQGIPAVSRLSRRKNPVSLEYSRYFKQGLKPLKRGFNMKHIKKLFSSLFALVLTVQCSGVTAFADDDSPRTEIAADGVVYTYNDDGSVTATIYTHPAVTEKRASSEDYRLKDHGDSYVNTSEDVTVTIEKTYSDGDMLVSVESDETGIVFYPETVAGVIPVEVPVAETR